MSPAEEVKSKLNIVDIIQDYLPLKKRGASYFANCPFHEEKTPSFHVSSERQFYKCFGCNEGGDVFDFVQKLEGVEFPEALRILAEKAGVKIEKFDPKIYTRRNRLLDLLDLAGRYYHEVLLRSEAATEARAYLGKRALKGTTIDLFNLGFAPNSWDALLNFLISKKYTAEESFAAGLLVKRERGEGFYDRFRGRIMFPIRDVHGNTVGFTARLLPSAEGDANAGGKYINTPQTDFYNKSAILYGLDMAKREIRTRDLAILVEGNMDVITCHEYGMKNVVAASGTALTIEQINLIRRFTDNVALSFDTDKAGEAAAEKGIGLLLQSGISARVIHFPPGTGKDPDEIIRKNPAVWDEAVTKAEPVMKYLFGVAERKYGQGSGEGRKLTAKMLMPFIARISDPIEQKFWLGELSAITGVTEEVLKTSYAKGDVSKTKEQINAPKQAVQNNEVLPRFNILSEQLLSFLLIAPQNFSFVLDRVTPAMLGSGLLKDLYEAAIVVYNNTGALKYADLETKLGSEPRFKDILQKIAIKGEENFGSLPPDELQKELLLVLKELKDCYLFEERKQLIGEITIAQREGDSEKTKELSFKMQELLKNSGEYL